MMYVQEEASTYDAKQKGGKSTAPICSEIKYLLTVKISISATLGLFYDLKWDILCNMVLQLNIAIFGLY